MIGVSYFGNRIVRHVAADMDDLAARGFTGVLHTMSENDLAYYRGTLGRIVEISHAAGLHVQVGPWGLGRTFGGEAETLFVAANPECGQVLDSGRRVAAGCPNHPRFRAFVRSWADAAVETGADRVFWDEPHWAHPSHFDEPEDRWGCRCDVCRAKYAEQHGAPLPAVLTPEVRAFREASLVEFIADVCAHVAGIGGRNTVCLLPLVAGAQGLSDWSAVASLETLDTLATDPYWQAFEQPARPFVGDFAARLAALRAEHGVGAQLWIQGFRLGPEDGDDIRTAVAAARAGGVDDLWTWGYEACGHMSHLGTRDPGRVWEILCDALLAVPAAPAAPALGTDGLTPPDAPCPDDLGALVTEGQRPDLADLDLRPTEEIVRLMAAEEHTVADAVAAAAPALAAAVDAIAERLGAGGRLVYVGAGTPGRLGVLDAAECGPTFGAADQVVALLAGGEDAIVRPKEGAEDDTEAAARDVAAARVGPSDAIVAISASGRTPYVVAAVAAARAAGALTVGVACHPGAVLSGAVDHAVEVVVGPEVVTGSTRLKAGSAQKLVLNIISTTAMVRLGHTYGNLMVDVSRSSGKLLDRARRIVAAATGCPPAEAVAALDEAGGEVKTAIVARLAGIGPDDARRRLAAAGGVVRRALGAP